MLPPYRTLSLRYFRLRWDRTALIVASIALGVATLVSTRMLNQCIDAAARQKAGLAVASDVQFLIQTGEAGVRKELLDPVRAVPGVRKARPWLFQRVQLTDLDHRVATLIGFEVTPELPGENPYGLRNTTK